MERSSVKIDVGRYFWWRYPRTVMLSDHRTDFSKGDKLMNKVEINLDMLCPLMLYGVCAKIYDTDVITIYNCSSPERTVEFLKKL
jgi:hypothetical protein